MKQLQLELQERLLIWGYEDEYEFRKDDEGMYFWNRATGAVVEITKEYELICKGDELTEEVAKGLVHQSIHTALFAHYVKDIPVNTYCYKSALDSFISAIESNGYFWGKCPVERPETGRDKLYDSLDTSNDSIVYHDNYHKRFNNWQEAESRTFNPSITLIFKIS